MWMALINLKPFLRAEEGQSLTEYAVILLLVSIAAIAGLTAIGVTISGMFDNLSSAISSGST
jgi:Flp pilus assembly pilin Flp